MIVIAPDKFKGTMDATDAAMAIALGLREAGVRDAIQLCPMADGGDGTAELLADRLPPDCAVVESHACIGPQCFGNAAPMLRSSYAFGRAIALALRTHSHVLAAIGGTACCDGGAGMLQALGLKAYDADGRLIDTPLTPRLLPLVARTELPPAGIGARITALSDVQASLVPSPGVALSALDFAPQKGFTAAELPLLRSALLHWGRIVAPGRSSAIDGAGGGIGHALATVLGADVRSGAQYMLDIYAPDFAAASLIITGEGRIDRQTGAGKVVAAVADLAARRGIPVLAVAGSVEGVPQFPVLAVDTPGTPPPSSRPEAMERLRAAVCNYFKGKNLQPKP